MPAFVSVLLVAGVAAASEYDRFIMANAEMGCYSMGAPNSSAENADDPYEAIAIKHGFTVEGLEALKVKYPGSQSAVGKEMMSQCPKQMGAMRGMGESPMRK